MYEVREGSFLPYIKCYKNTTGSITDLTRENLKFDISALGAYSRIYSMYMLCKPSPTPLKNTLITTLNSIFYTLQFHVLPDKEQIRRKRQMQFLDCEMHGNMPGTFWR